MLPSSPIEEDGTKFNCNFASENENYNQFPKRKH